jgi:hypothetical protein
MKVTKTHLKQLIETAVLKEQVRGLLIERMSVATVSDITRFRPSIEEWAEVLVDELQKKAERMKGLDDKRRNSIITMLVDAVAKSLISSTGSMTVSSLERQKKDKEEEQYKKMRDSRRYGYSG